MMIEFNEEHRMVRRMVRDFARKEMAPIAIEMDEKEQFPHETFKKMAELNLLGLPFDEKYGGAGFDLISYTITLEELARVCASTALSYSAHVSLAASPIDMFGTEEQKQKYLVPLAKGEKIGSFGLSEPEAGSDAGSIQTTARKEGDRYILNGSKMWITNAEVADIFVVAAVTDKEKGRKGISNFIVERGFPGFEVGKKEKKCGMRASPTNMLHFSDCEVPAENLLGQENAGYRQFLTTLDGGRVGIAAQALGIAKEALKRSLNYAQQRVQFGKKIGEFQAIQFKLADMATKIHAAELMIYDAAWKKQNGQPYIHEAGMAKLFATEMATEAANQAIQIHGGVGYTKEYEVERFWRDAKLLEIGEGTSEVQRIVIYRELLKQIEKI
ncbi:MAG TPA: acyl-CoA dehydrogenase, partial [Caldithrix abyssi]|nr:acyl-CoA dehydrogenase [Caldithrix abyssi]